LSKRGFVVKVQNFNVEVDCPTTTALLPFLQKLSREALQHLHEEEQARICFAINEGLINAIKYSIGADTTMRFAINKNDQYTEFIIKNYGAEISDIVFENTTTRSFDDVLWDEHGRGLLIINEIADEWSFSRDELGRNILKIRMAGEKVYV